MISVFIDANIFLEVQLNQGRAADCKKLLKLLEQSENLAWTNSFLVYSMILTIQHKTGDLERCMRLLKILNAYSGLNVFNPGFSTILGALQIQQNNQLDFDDALVVSSMERLSIFHIVTFDDDFRDIKAIKVIDPLEALNLLSN